MTDYILMFIYLILILINVFLLVQKKSSKTIVIITFLLLFLLMSGHRYSGDGDAIDFLAYYLGYNNIAESSQDNFYFYYLFYISQIVGNLIGLNYYLWLAIMTSIFLYIIYRLISKHKYNYHFFLLFFMLYFVFMFYGGLKFYFGFVLFLCAYSYIIRSQKHDIFRFIFYLILAGGFHVMYYSFSILLLLKTKKYDIKIRNIVYLFIFVAIIILFTDRNLNLIQLLVDRIGNEKISIYFSERTNLGFVLPIGIHIFISSYALFLHTGIKKRFSIESREYQMTKKILYATLLLIVFYPLFIVSLTFMRILTAYSMVIFTTTGTLFTLTYNKDKQKVFLTSWLIILTFYFINLYLNDYWFKTFRPFFDNYYF